MSLPWLLPAPVPAVPSGRVWRRVAVALAQSAGVGGRAATVAPHARAGRVCRDAFEEKIASLRGIRLLLTPYFGPAALYDVLQWDRLLG